MKDQTKSAIKLLEALTERAKELTCLYAIEELIKKPHMEIDNICEGIIYAIPPGWQYPEICQAKIELGDEVYQTPNFCATQWMQSAEILVQDEKIGSLSVHYTKEAPKADHGPFLKEEKKLIETIADRLGHYLLFKKMENVVTEWKAASEDLSENRKRDWEAVLDLLRQTDNTLFLSISNKMLNHLSWSGIKEAEELRQFITHPKSSKINGINEETGRQHPSQTLNFSTELVEKIFGLAADHLSGEEILSRIHMWINEDRLSSLVQIVQRHLPLSEITDALRRYYYTAPDAADAKYPVSRELKVSLIRRILSDQPEYISLAKNHVDIDDLYHLLQKVIFSPESHGKLGSKSADFFLHSQILKKAKADSEILNNLQIPNTWYVSSDMMLHFMHYNNIDEVIEQKYKEIERIRLEYPHVVQTFTNSVFPPEMIKGLSIALDDLGEKPLIVRSSNVFCEPVTSSFYSKCKSIFLSNQGTKQERLIKLLEAVAEVYASSFSPEPVEYRANRGLLDYSDEMGVMIQEAVGASVGHYFLPTYAGTAVSRNYYRWSSSIKCEDGLVRVAPGFCLRTKNQTKDDFPVLFSPGKPSMKVNRSQIETDRYAPKSVNVLNIKTQAFETIKICDLMKDYGERFPSIEHVVSLQSEGNLHPLEGKNVDFKNDHFLVTFEGLISRSRFVLQIRAITKILEEKLKKPVEIRFASDGENLCLLQCCAQNGSNEFSPVPIPKDIPQDMVIFSANRNISNGMKPDITHVVFINPLKYEYCSHASAQRQLKEAIGKLNKILPKKQFILMGPSQWFLQENKDQDDNIQYSDISNTALLIEVMDQNGNDKPQPSFYIPFFQELIESGISYLPLYPDEEETKFNKQFLNGGQNILPEILPEYKDLSEVVRLIDIPKCKDGRVMQVLMNAELDEALAVLTEPKTDVGNLTQEFTFQESHPENYWRWRYGMAEQMASELDFDRFGVQGVYLFGSTKNGTAGPGSDIDILVHFRGDKNQQEDLTNWLEGWSLCLDEMNFLKTGYRSKGLLDVHLVTDEDIANRTSYAVKINAVTDAARPLKTRTHSEN